MSSLQKGKAKKSESTQSKKRQLLNVIHHSVPFLQIFSIQDLDYLEQRLHIFVFAKGQVLAKEKQTIDYVGVIAEGRAVAKSKHFQIGQLIGHQQIFGDQITHEQSIIGQSDGIIIAVRLYDLLTMERFSLRNKIVSQIASYNFAELIKRQSLVKHIMQFQTVDEKKISKYFSPEFNSFYNQLEPKQKAKFGNFFPFYAVKQKQLIANSTLKPYLLYVIQGNVIAKIKQEQKIIESGKFYNIQNFIFQQNCPQNVYCLSSEAVILLIDKQVLRNNFKYESFKSLLSIFMNNLTKQYKKEVQLSDDREVQGNQKWSIFKKYPDTEIIPLPKKNENRVKKTDAGTNKEINIVTFQTLFREQLSNNDKKQKTQSSAAQSGYEKLYTLKTQPHGKELQTELQLQKLKKQVQILSQKLKFNQQISKQTKLELIQTKSRISLGEVFKQIKKLYQQNEVAHSNPNNNDSGGDQKKVTFKEAFDNQMKQSKIQVLVAKCAFRWLYLTRKKKAAIKKN